MYDLKSIFYIFIQIKKNIGLIQNKDRRRLEKKVNQISPTDFSNQKSLGNMTFEEFRQTLFDK